MAWDDDLDQNSVAYAIAADQSRFIRVVACPGTGKSFALKRRVARLLESDIAPERILPVTFTKVAAEEQRRLFYVGVTRVKADPASNRPGVLLLTGSRTMTLADAMQSNIRPAPQRYGVVDVHLSRFINELGPSAPAPRAR